MCLVNLKEGCFDLMRWFVPFTLCAFEFVSCSSCLLMPHRCPDRSVFSLWAERPFSVFWACNDCKGSDCQGHCKHSQCLWKEWCWGSSLWGKDWALAQRATCCCLYIILLNKHLLFLFLCNYVAVPHLTQSPPLSCILLLFFLFFFFFFLATAKGGRTNEGPPGRNNLYSSGRTTTRC